MNNKVATIVLKSSAATGVIFLALNGGVVQAESQAENGQPEMVGLDTMSVTASRVERGTKEVPGAIDVIDEKRIDAEKMFNVKDAIKGTPGVLIDSKNGGYDSRLIIRGAGQKANYGVREIMIIRDGVPMTDPDSFSRFDFIDTQDIERIEITKGPGSLYGSGSAGGTIQIISKSVFDNDEQRIKLGIGEEGQENLHFRLGGDINDSNAISITGSHRAADSDWRDWNKFDTQQISLKHGLMLDGGAIWETELSYSQADMQIPTSMTKDEFEQYKSTGEQRDTSSPWQRNGRYSTIWFFNSRYEQEFGDLTFTPRIYFNSWDHFHPVTGGINDNPGTDVFGTDLEISYRHKLWGESTLVAGVTARQDDTDNSKKYKYLDIQNGLAQVQTDAKGDLMEEENATNTLVGLFMQETLRPNDRTTIDIGFRYDRNNFDIHNTEYATYNWGGGGYTDHANAIVTETDKTFDLFSPKIGVTYAINDRFNVYGLIAQSEQVPSESEIQSNNALDSATARNIEVGLKGRAENWSMDVAIYQTDVTDEIVSVIVSPFSTEFQNAGETLKKGIEFSGRIKLSDDLWLGAGYAYSDYQFEDFIENVRIRGRLTPFDRSGNQIPYVPRSQFNVNLDYSHASGFKVRVQADSWGSYYTDNANSQKYKGYDFVTNLMLGYDIGQHSIALNVSNLFDKRYAVEVKGTGDDTNYYAASPRTAMLSYTYSF